MEKSRKRVFGSEEHDIRDEEPRVRVAFTTKHEVSLIAHLTSHHWA